MVVDFKNRNSGRGKRDLKNLSFLFVIKYLEFSNIKLTFVNKMKIYD